MSADKMLHIKNVKAIRLAKEPQEIKPKEAGNEDQKIPKEIDGFELIETRVWKKNCAPIGRIYLIAQKKTGTHIYSKSLLCPLFGTYEQKIGVYNRLISDLKEKFKI